MTHRVGNLVNSETATPTNLYFKTPFSSQDEEVELVTPSSSSPKYPRNRLEEPKTALQSNVNWKSLFLHTFALCATASVVQLSFRSVYLCDTSDCTSFAGFDTITINDVLKIFQYVAKVYEIILVASLTAIVMHFARLILIGAHGLPFGLLNGGYQVSSFNHLWSVMKLLPSRSVRSTVLAVTMTILIIYANALGPSSAILIVPSLDWWPITNMYNSQPLTAYLGNDSNVIYPMKLQAQDLLGSEKCEAAIASTQCPGNEFVDLNNYIMGLSDYDIHTTFQNTTFNITMMESYSGWSKMLVSEQQPVLGEYDLYDSSFSITTTLHHSIVELLGLVKDYIDLNSIGEAAGIARPLFFLEGPSKVLSPVVQAQCSFFSYRDARAGIFSTVSGGNFPTSQLSNFSSYEYPAVTDWTVDQSLRNFSRSTNLTNFTWVDLSFGASPPRNASLGALASLPYLTMRNDTMIQDSLLLPCTIDARWASTDVSVDAAISDTVSTNLTYPFEQIVMANSTSITNAIAIDPDWATLHGSSRVDTNGTNLASSTSMQILFDWLVQCGSSNWTSNATCVVALDLPAYGAHDFEKTGVAISKLVAMVLSMVVADGLSRVSYRTVNPLLLVNGTSQSNLTVLNLLQDDDLQRMHPQTLATYMPFNIGIQRYGYGYGLQTSVTVKLSIAVVLAHAGLVILYGGFRIYAWGCSKIRGQTETWWTSNSWSDVGEILALALLSDAKQARQALGDAGAGLMWEKDALQQAVRIREGPDGTAQLVVGDDVELGGALHGTYRPMAIGKKYS